MRSDLPLVYTSFYQSAIQAIPFQGSARKRPAQWRARGFTLIEVMVVAAILGITAIFAVPTTQSLIVSNRAITQTNAVIAALSLARSESIRRSRAVTVCPSSNGTDCLDTISWNNGWIIFVDSQQSGNNPAPVDLADGLLRRAGPISAGNSLTGPVFVRYFGTGMLSIDSTASDADGFSGFDFTLATNACDAGTSRGISLTLGGRPRITQCG